MRHAGVLRKPWATTRLSPTRWNPRAVHHCVRQAGGRSTSRCPGCVLAVSCATGHPATTMQSSRRCGQWATVRKPVTVALQVVCAAAAGGSSHRPDPIRGTVLLPADSGLTAFVSAVYDGNEMIDLTEAPGMTKMAPRASERDAPLRPPWQRTGAGDRPLP